jgi:hypothetical protein
MATQHDCLPAVVMHYTLESCSPAAGLPSAPRLFPSAHIPAPPKAKSISFMWVLFCGSEGVGSQECGVLAGSAQPAASWQCGRLAGSTQPADRHVAGISPLSYNGTPVHVCSTRFRNTGTPVHACSAGWFRELGSSMGASKSTRLYSAVLYSVMPKAVTAQL